MGKTIRNLVRNLMNNKEKGCHRFIRTGSDA